MLVHLAYSPIVNGLSSFTVPVPNIPTIRGLQLLLQAVNVATVGSPLDLSTGLAVVLG